MSYCLYLRKSRADIEAEAHGEGETLARHEKTLMEIANRQKLNVTKIYKEIVSGENISSRPVVQELLADVEKGIYKGVLVMEIERLARGDTIDQGVIAQTFKYSETVIITPMKIYDPNNEFDEEYFEFGLFMSRREYKTIRRRIQAGRLVSAKEGKYVPGKPPYGYNRIKLENQKGYSLKQHPEQADVVRLIFNLYTDPTRSNGIAYIINYLTLSGIAPPKSEAWNSSTVRRIIDNPVYAGKITWNYKKTVSILHNGTRTKKRVANPKSEQITIDGLHEPIISLSQWELAQTIRKSKYIPPIPNHLQIKNPFAGLIYCSICGRKIVRNTPRKGVNFLLCETPKCVNIGSNLSVVEDKFLRTLEKWLEDSDINWQQNIEVVDNDFTVEKQALQNCQLEIDKIQKQLDSAYNLVEQGVYTIELFVERSQKLKAKEKELHEKKQQLEDNLEASKKQSCSISKVIPKVQSVLNVYKSLESNSEKNLLLKEVIERIDYLKTERYANFTLEVKLKDYN